MTETAELTTYCATHPTVESGLRCNKCDKYICPKCSVQTKVGYRCKSCIKGQQAVFNTAENRDFLTGSVVAMIVGVVGSAINIFPAGFGFFGFFIAFFLGGAVGRFAADLTRRAISKRRGKNLFLTIAILGTLATLPLITSTGLAGMLFSFAFATALYSSLRGINVRR